MNDPGTKIRCKEQVSGNWSLRHVSRPDLRCIRSEYDSDSHFRSWRHICPTNQWQSHAQSGPAHKAGRTVGATRLTRFFPATAAIPDMIEKAL